MAHAAGRTDAGVHSIGQGVSFSAPASWTDSALRRALNALLPSDCWVESVHPMQPGFHARKSALSRRYRYHIGLDEASASPFRRQFEWALGKPLDLELLSAAARVIRGEHDFRAFAAKTDKPHYRCRRDPCGVEPADRRPGGELRDRGRPVPPAHGADARRHHGGHRARAPPAGGHGGAAPPRRTTPTPVLRHRPRASTSRRWCIRPSSSPTPQESRMPRCTWRSLVGSHHHPGI